MWNTIPHFFHIMLTAAEKNRIVALLQRFDCNNREAEIYLQCLSMEPSSVQEIARKMSTNRFTVHSSIEQLIVKGLLFETRKGKRRLIAAEEPSVLFRLIERKKREIDQMTGNVEYAAKLLTSLLPEKAWKPSVRLYEGIDGYKKMLEETLQAKNDVLVFSNVQLLSSLVGPEYLEGYMRKRGRKKIQSRLIFPICPFAEYILKKSKEYRMDIRYLPKGVLWKSGIFAWNDCIALLSYTQNKLTCTIVENPDIAHFFRTIIFEMCWRQADPAL